MDSKQGPSFGSRIPKMGFLFIAILVMAFCVLSFTSGSTPVPQTGSLYVGEKKNVINISTSDSSHLLEIPTQRLEDIAVDNHRSIIWVGTRKEVIQYTLEGTEVFRYPLRIRDHPEEDDEEDNDEGDEGERVAHISLNPADGSLWVGAKDEVIRLSSDGYELLNIRDIGHIEDVSVDISDGSCWVGLKDKAIKYSPEGAPLISFNMESGNKVQAFAAEPILHGIWIGSKKGLIKINKDGIEEFRTEELSDIQDIKIDIRDASAWMVTKKQVYKYNSAGDKLFYLRPCAEDDDDEYDKKDKGSNHKDDHKGSKSSHDDDHDDDSKCEGNLVTLAVDSSDSTGYVAWKKSILKLSKTGESLLWLKGFKQIKALDISLPKLGIDITEPLDGAIVNTPSITVKGTVTDLAARVIVNGLEASVAGNAFQIDNVQLNPGPNTITATAANISGISVSDSITVTYQPPISIRILSPQDSAIFSTSLVDVTGTVSDSSASVEVNGSPASVIGNTFQIQGLQLNPGINVITATATLSGVSVSDSIVVTYEPPPPLTIDINAPLDGAAFSISRIDVTGSVSDSSASVTVNGITAAVSGNTFTAAGIPITPGENTITAITADKTGRTASDTVKVNYTWMNVSITYPMDGDILDATPIDVEGVVSDPSAHVEVSGREAEVTGDGSFIAYGVRLYEGQNQITAQASNAISQTDEDTLQVTYEPPPAPLSVSLLAPENGASIETPYFKVTGVVTDPNATVLVNDTIASVDENGFYTASVYTCDEQMPGEGVTRGYWYCDLTVSAYSKDGQTISSAVSSYTYIPSDDPLTVKITDPAQNQIVTYSPYEIQGELHDVLSSVAAATITVNSIPSGAYGIGENSFSASTTLNDGLNYITVRVTNAVGHDAFDTIKVIYEPTDKPLGISIYSPLEQAIVNYSPITVFGGVTHSAAEVDVNGVFADVDKDFRGFKAVSIPLSPGENIITAAVWIPTEETATDSRIVIYDPSYPSPPAPILSPLPEYSQGSVEVSGLATPGYKVDIFANGTSIAVVYANSNGLFKAALSLPDEGPNHIFARAVDIYGNKSNLSNEEVVIRDRTEPHIKNAYIVYDNFSMDWLGLAASSVRIAGETEALAKVEVTVDNHADYKYNLTADNQGRFSINTHISMGYHSMFIKTTDSVGNTAQYSDSYPIHPFNTASPPQPIIDPLPSPINETSIAIEGNAYAGFYVQVYRNNELMGAVQADNRGRFRLEGVSLAPGENIIKVRQIEQTLHWPIGYIDITEAYSNEVVVDVISGTPIRPNVKIDFPVNGAVTDAEFLPLRGTIDAPDATLRLNGYYYNYNGYATAANGRFLSNHKIPLVPGENTLWVEAASPDGSRGVDKITVYSKKDSQVPSVNITSHGEGEEVYDQYITISGTMADSAQNVITNESEAAMANGAFESSINIFSSYVYNPYGYERMLTAWAVDANGSIGHHHIPFRYKYIPAPTLSIISPLSGETLGASPVAVTGTVTDASSVEINGVPAIIDNNTFTAQINLKEGQNAITAIAKNTVKASTSAINITYSPGTTVTLESIAIEPSTSTVPIGGTIQMSVTGTYSNGEKIDLTRASVWTSSDTNTITVNNGLITGQQMGSAAITAAYQGLTASSAITVGQPTLKTIIIAYEWQTPDGATTWFTDNPEIQKGETLQLKAFGQYTDGNLYTLSMMPGQLTWTSSSPDIAAIAPNGLSTGITKGAAAITATHEYGGATVTGATTLTVEPAPVYIFITSPTDNSTTNKTEITITGTVITQANEVGITVNGIIANVYANQFTANHVPLAEGNNVITATAIDSNGATAEARITVTVLPSANYIRLTSNIESGIAPLEATLTVDSSIPLNDTSTSLTYTNPANIEVLSATPEEYKVRINAEGIYQFTVNATNEQGNAYSDTIAITVLNRETMDALLQGKWEGMKGALMGGDIETALTYFVDASKDNYRQIFTELGSDTLNSIFSAVTELKLYTAYGRLAGCGAIRVEAGGTYSYPVTFILDENGIWKILGL